jgi:hypothetical protein
MIREDQDRDLGRYVTSFIYIIWTGFKAESECESYYRYPMNPTTPILG